MSDDTLPELPGMQGVTSKQFIIRNSWGLSDELEGLSKGLRPDIDFVIETPGTSPLYIRCVPQHEDHFKRDMSDPGIFHIWGGDCFQIDPDTGQQMSREYSCNGYVQSDITRPVDVGRITINTKRPEGDT